MLRTGFLEPEPEPVTALTPLHKDTLLEVRIEGKRDALRPSTHHPFWARQGDDPVGTWVNSGKLHIGDLLEKADGSWRRITGINPVSQEETVYNFTVANDHDYFVGETGFLVHNANCPCISGLANGDSPLQQALRLESANSPFTPEGWLIDLAIQGSQMIIAPGGLGSHIPGGFGKYSTPTF